MGYWVYKRDWRDYCDCCGTYLRSGIEYRSGICNDCYWDDWYWYDW